MRLKYLPLISLTALAAPAFAISVNISDFTYGTPADLAAVGTANYTGASGQFTGVLGGQSFIAYCAELTQDFHLSTSYDYTMVTPGSYFAGQKASDLSRLFTATQGFVIDTYTSAALQAAIWEIIYQTGTGYDLTGGDFTVGPETPGDALTAAALSTVNGFLLNLDSYSPLATFSVLTNANNQDFITPSIPEPQTWALMFAGLGVVGALARRRRR